MKCQKEEKKEIELGGFHKSFGASKSRVASEVGDMSYFGHGCNKLSIEGEPETDGWDIFIMNETEE